MPKKITFRNLDQLTKRKGKSKMLLIELGCMDKKCLELYIIVIYNLNKNFIELQLGQLWFRFRMLDNIDD